VDLGSELVHYLVAFYSADQVRAFYKQAGDAAAARTKTTIVINQGSTDARSHSGIALATPSEFAAFMNACRQALDRLGGGTGLVDKPAGSYDDFSHRIVGT
jgi:hypothetical protein